MKRTILLFAMLLIAASTGVAQEKTAIKPPAPRALGLGPPPLPLESDVLRYVFEHFPEENRTEVMAFIGAHFKSELPEFRKLAGEDARRATAFMIDLVNDALMLMDVASKDKQLADMMVRQKDLERKAARKAKEMALAEEAEKDALKKELQKMLEQAFDAKQELLKRDLGGMQEELQKLSLMIEKREKYRAKIIEKKLSEMTEDEKYLQW